jgi:UDP-glucose 4-epimerase
MTEILSQYKNSRVIVTGGAGFIGSHIVEKLLSLGSKVSVIDTMLCGNKIEHLQGNKNLLIHNIDVRDVKSMTHLFKGVDMVFHLAAVVGVEETQHEPLEVLNVEILGTLNVITLSVKNKAKRFIFASSSEVYGDSLQPMVEDGPFNPRSTYALTKMVGEHYCRANYQKHGLEYTILRYFNTYGPRQDDRFVISRFIDRALHNKEIQIYGDGNQTRDFTYVEDSVQMSLLSAVSDKGICQEFNIGTGKAVSVNKLSEIMLDTLKLSDKVKRTYTEYDNVRSREIEIFNRLANIDKAVDLLAYQPETNLELGIRKCIEWYQNRK